jgi:hypothetical protein
LGFYLSHITTIHIAGELKTASVGGPGITAVTMSTFRDAATAGRSTGHASDGSVLALSQSSSGNRKATGAVAVVGAGGALGADGAVRGVGGASVEAAPAKQGYQTNYNLSDYYPGVAAGGGVIVRSSGFRDVPMEHASPVRSGVHAAAIQEGKLGGMDVAPRGVGSPVAVEPERREVIKVGPVAQSVGNEGNSRTNQGPETNFEYFVHDVENNGLGMEADDEDIETIVTPSSRSTLKALPNTASRYGDAYARQSSPEYGFLDDNAIETNSRRSKTCTDEIGDALDLENSVSNATSIYEGNIGGKPSSKNSKVFLGALVSGKLIKRARPDEVPLYNTYPRPNDMHINPLFVDDDDPGQAASYGYINEPVAAGQVPPYEFSRAAYNTNAPMYSTQPAGRMQAPMQAAIPMQMQAPFPMQAHVPMQTPVPIQTSVSMPQVMLDQGSTFMQAQPQVMVQGPNQAMQQPAYFVQNQPQVMQMSPQVSRLYQPQQGSHPASNGSYGTSSGTSLLTPRANHSNRYTAQSNRGLLLHEAAESLRRDYDIQRASNVPGRLDEEEYYFVSSDGLDRLHIPAENVEEYVYEMVK